MLRLSLKIKYIVLLPFFLWIFSFGCTPKNPSCLEDNDCPVKNYCKITTGICVQDCLADADCPPSKICSERGKCTFKKVSCSSHAKKECENGHLYWFDSCHFREEKAQDCGNLGCQDGRCVPPKDSCGDGLCSAQQGENCTTCPKDCACKVNEKCVNGHCQNPQLCGNGTCDTQQGENCATCPKDCPCQKGTTCINATCQNTNLCGNGICDSQQGENCSTCTKDCLCTKDEICVNGTCQKKQTCGNGQCEANKGEDCATCPQDCACQAGEQCQKGICQKLNPCGNNLCEANKGENCATCPKDCACQGNTTCKNGVCEPIIYCGNGQCEPNKGENCSTCPKDCACQANTICKNATCVPCQCTPRHRRCNGNNVEECSADCTRWTLIQACGQGQQCQNSSCQASCGNGRCEANQQENCSTCPQDCACGANQRCQNGVCRTCVCRPGEKRCRGYRLEQCTPDCQSWQFYKNCDPAQNLYCNSAIKDCKCRSSVSCKRFEYRCFGNERRYCYTNTYGCTYWKKSSFQCRGTTPICYNGRCCACRPGTKRCQGSALQECSSDCRQWRTIEQCLSTDYRYCSSYFHKCYCFHRCFKIGYSCDSKGQRRYCTTNKYGCKYWKSVPCPKGYNYCKDGLCCSCKPGETKCDGLYYQKVCTCNSWKKERCTKGFCNFKTQKCP